MVHALTFTVLDISVVDPSWEKSNHNTIMEKGQKLAELLLFVKSFKNDKESFLVLLGTFFSS